MHLAYRSLRALVGYGSAVLNDQYQLRFLICNGELLYSYETNKLLMMKKKRKRKRVITLVMCHIQSGGEQVEERGVMGVFPDSS